MLRITLPLLTMLTLIFPIQAFSAAPTPAELGYNALHAVEKSTFGHLEESDRRDAIAQEYERGMRQESNEAALRSASDDALGWYLKAADLAAFYARQPRHLEDTGRILAEMERRGIAVDHQRATFYRLLIGYRRFNEARTYLDRHPSLDVEPVPTIVGSIAAGTGEEHAYAVDQERYRLLPRRFRLSEGTRVVVVSHPLCAFSRSAMQTVESDPVMAAALNGNATWLAPVDTRLHFDEVQAWNRNHPAMPVVIARHREDWPMIEEWATPNFYLLQDGEVLDHFSGWPTDGSHEGRLLRMLERGGLL